MSEEALQIAEKRSKRQARNRKIHIHLHAEFQRIARSEKKAFLSGGSKRPASRLERRAESLASPRDEA